MFEMRSDPEVMQYIQRPIAKSHDDAMALIKVLMDSFDSNSAITWGVFEKGKDKLMGTAGFWQIEKNNFRGEIGYLLHKDLWGKGIMHEILAAIISYGFNEINLNAIVGICNPVNEASIKLLERHNFKKEGQLSDALFFEGQFYDSVVFCLLNR